MSDEIVAEGVDAGFQYHDRRHEAETALSGMWLFIASEILFFGGIVWAWVVLRMRDPAAFQLAAGHTTLPLGSLNTALLVTSSFLLTRGVMAGEAGRNRDVVRACRHAAALGAGFLVLKGVEWGLDFHEHLFPGPGFAIQGDLRGGGQVFFTLYFVATGLHGIHMLIGLGLLAWVAHRAGHGDYTRRHHTQVQVVGLYWSFVDVVWLVFYPLFYVLARP